MSSLDNLVENTIDNALLKAKENWSRSGSGLDNLAMESISVDIDSIAVNKKKTLDGFFGSSLNSSQERNLVCISADLRGSSERLKTKHSDLGKYQNRFQRAYFISSALLPSLEVVISYKNGFVTEFLGDGVLGFFDADKDEAEAIRNSGSAARYITDNLSHILEDKLKEFYSGERIRIGVGLAKSPTILSMVGLGSGAEIKAFGPCVYDASKLNYGYNDVYVEASLEAEWPVSKTGHGGISFERIVRGEKNLNYYKMKSNKY